MMNKLTYLLLCFVLSIAMVSAQTTSVRGVVLSGEDNEPIIGASVLAKGTTVGTITNLDGEFTLKVPNSAKTLVISYIGMATQEVAVAPNLRILLESDTQALDEVIVVAYGQQRKEAITGAVANIKAESFERRPIASATAALEGQALGVQVNNAYGEPGADPSIRIRGFNSINGDNSPLYVVNGVPLGGNMSDINPTDIESISVLKDASSAALYGNKAANGVILITTKSGRLGEENINIQATVNQGFYQRAIKEYERLNPQQFMESYWQARRNALYTDGLAKGKYVTYNDANGDALEAVIEGIGEKYNIFNKDWNSLYDANGKLSAGTQILDGYTDDLDWYDGLERTGSRSQYNISARGGTKKATYYMSLGHLDEKGFLKHSDGARTTGNIKVDVNPTDWFKTGLSINASSQEYNSMTASTDNASSYINPFYYARNVAPIYPVHLHDSATGDYVLDANGEKQYDPGTSRKQNNNRHIQWETELNKDKTYRNTMDAIAYADIMFLNDFVFTVKGNMNNRTSSKKSYDNSVIGDGAGKGRMSQTEYRYKNYLLQELLNWKRTFGKVHNVDVLIGHENFNYKYQYTYLYKTDEKFANIMELTNFTTMTTLNGYQSGYKTEGYFGRAAYNYDQTYFGEFSFRRDGSSRFYEDNRWGNFWSLGGSWILSNEEYIKQFDWINHLKLRAAYGEVGQDSGVGYYAWMALYTSTQNGGNGAYYKSQNEAKEISWEKAKSMSIALEANLFDRLDLSIEYFDKTSEDLLFDVELPSSIGSISTGSSGRPEFTKNFGSVSNRGFEIGLGFDIIRTKDWTWNVGTNLNFLKNKIEKLPPEYGEDGYIDGTKKYLNGHSIYDFWMYKYVGVDRINGRSLYLLNSDDYYIADEGYTGTGAAQENEERTKMTADYTIIDGEAYVYNTTYGKKDWSGSAIPKVYGSFSTSLRYKQFELSGLFTFQTGGKMLDYSYSSLMSVGATPSALHVDVLKSWTPEQAGTGIDPNGTPALNTSQSTYSNATSDRFLISSDYLNIKNVTLSYLAPKRLAHKIGLKGLTLSASAENLLILTKLQGMSPQQSWSGINNNGYVPARVVTFGVNVNF
ncbi:TonB-dependent receptor [Massilibacteroides sp.]|uniref:SusC/RagA family TonB-linked outer membrane protein n=1 Tax=Massilibacteroides sp. TaxID=2034766 RepID=UPI0026057A1B|nr:TonB-dependent receptor [Massilibacteroides sp.]MDD4515476.1 TonB-dependent receptor [Massilibacteroides sp.]